MRITLTAVFFLVACGTEPVKTTPLTDATTPTAAPASQATVAQSSAASSPNDPQQSFAVTKAANLPTCDASREGALADIKSESRFVVCETGAWASADLTTGAVDTKTEPGGKNCPSGGQMIQSFLDKNGNGILDPGEPTAGDAKYVCNGADGTPGKTGATGATGAAGKAGADGKAGAAGSAGVAGANGTNGATGSTGATGTAGTNGTDNHIATTYTCSGTVYSAAKMLASSAPPSLHTAYKIVVSNYGDVTATGQILWDDVPNLNQAGGYSLLFQSIYAKADTNADTASVHGMQNWVSGNNTGTWDWTLNRTNNNAQVIYTDLDMSPTTLTFPLTCTVASY